MAFRVPDRAFTPAGSTAFRTCPQPQSGPQYWRSLDELSDTPEFRRWVEREFPAGASEFNDVLGAGVYLRNRADVDPQRIGLWGGSYGGYLTAMGLSRASDLFAAGVDIHGVHDWNIVIRNFVPAYDPQA